MATVVFSCVACASQFRVKPEQEGKNVRCPQCQAPNLIPEGTFRAPATPPRSEADARVESLTGAVDQVSRTRYQPLLPAYPLPSVGLFGVAALAFVYAVWIAIEVRDAPMTTFVAAVGVATMPAVAMWWMGLVLAYLHRIESRRK
jgi:hypothetical protein